MKKYYIVSLIASFFVAAICLGATASFVSTWSKKERDEIEKIAFSKTSWAYKLRPEAEEIGHASNANPLEISLAGITEVEVAVPDGDVKISAGKDAAGTFTAQELADGCQLRVTRRKDELTIRFSKIDKKSEGCSGSLIAEIPSSVDLHITGGQGDVTVEKMKAEIKAHIGSGKLTIAESKGVVRGEVGVGDVLISGVSPEIKVDLGVGKLDVKLMEKLNEGEWSFKVGMGSISVEVPNGQIVNEKYTTGMGSKTLLNKEKAPSEFKISATSGVGDIATTVK
ncbi:hypothetical protein [Bdellovibrio sp. KM01]|uniref:hypothetical protein n=1 Tax=Bdellovibrio sp. KM01 TaxID=2748865 RepID=UPI0015EA4AF0|nr:hypothetical protein [Bdellovibrio sp. KM01]QLY26520.1 hypothetical protein HW988_05725 [Bdellovibrio sp. KM01]